MTSTQEDIKKFKKFLLYHKKGIKGKVRAIARETGIHFNTIYNYLDGFHPDPEKCKAIMDAAEKYLPEQEQEQEQ